MKVQGRDCTLTVAKDNEYYPLPYSEETVRQTSKGYSLPGSIGIRNRDKRIITGKSIEGCFVTRLEYQNVLALFLLLFNCNEAFDLLADRVCEKIIYKNVAVKSFELRADNSNPFYFRLDVKDTDDSYVDDWPVGMPALLWKEDCGGFDRLNHRTYYYNGHNVIADLKTLPLVYRFEINGSFTEKTKYTITLYFPLSTEHFVTLNKIEKLSIVIDLKDGISLDLYNLKADGSLTDINCADTVLCSQKFICESHIVLTIRNQQENKQVVL